MKHLIYLTIFPILFSNYMVAQTPADPADSLELVNLYNSTGGPNWSIVWNLNQPVDNWPGISLNASGQVEYVFLGNEDLVGTLPMLTLPGMIYFDVGANDLTGSIPSFTNCPKLEQLYLEENDFTGSLPSLTGLDSLVKFHAFDNNLTGAIPDYNLPSLKELLLSSNNLSSVPAFSNMPSLEKLELYLNFPLPIIPDFNLPSLQRLDMGFCYLGGGIPPLLGCPNLSYLYLADNFLAGSVPDFGTTHPNLSSLYLQVNQLSHCPPLAGLSNLNTLALGSNLFTFDDLIPQLGVANSFTYSIQGPYDINSYYPLSVGDSLVLSFPIDDSINNNVYVWYLDGNIYASSNSNTLVIDSITTADAGEFTCSATNPNLPNLTIEQHSIQVDVSPAPPMGVNPADSTQLANLFNSTNGPNWISTWNLSQPASTWPGITMTPNGRIQSINLPNNGLSGILPALDLPDLRSLNLENNALAGSVPNFNMAPMLDSLLLANNLFDSCPLLAANSTLDTVSLYGNQLTFKDLLPNAGINRFEYAPQAVTLSQDLMAQVAGNVELHFPIDSQITSNEYVWIYNGGTFDTTTSNSLPLSNLTLAQSGEYTCQASNSALPDLILELKPFQLTVEEVNGLEQLASDEVRLFPNPTIDLLQFSLAENLAVQDWHIRIMDLSGKVIIEQQQAGINHIQVDVSKLAAGVYVAELIGDQHRWTSRWVKTTK